MELGSFQQQMSDCTLCPRKCHANRLAGQTGYCGQDSRVRAARAALHFWEEPCISGTVTDKEKDCGAVSRGGSGAVFFCGCNLGCIFCQNYQIAHGHSGAVLSQEKLCRIFLNLQEQGAYNINLVTATHFLPQVAHAVRSAKKAGLTIPIVYNTGGYEEADSLKLLDGLVDIYLPDLKYFSPELSRRCANAPDYFEKASAALAEMFRQVGRPLFDSSTNLMKRGMLVRHLILPGETRDSKKILRYLHEAYGNDIYVSIMNQYTPMPRTAEIPPLNRRVTPQEYERVLSFAGRIGIEQGFLQEEETASESFIPEFNLEGLL